MRHNGANEPKDRYWKGTTTGYSLSSSLTTVDLTDYNYGKQLDMNAVMAAAGGTVATEVFVNYFYDEASTAAIGMIAGKYGTSFDAPHILSAAGSDRFMNLTGSMYDFYSKGLEQIAYLKDKISGGDISDSGMRYSKLWGYKDDIHKGIDFSYAKGTDLKSIFGGRVYDVTGNDGSAGRSVRIDIGFYFEDAFIFSGIRAADFHMEETSVKIGDKVAGGESLGKSGNSNGTAAGGQYHRHLEMTIDGSLWEATLNGSNPYYSRSNALLSMLRLNDLSKPIITDGNQVKTNPSFSNHYRPGPDYPTYGGKLYLNLNSLF